MSDVVYLARMEGDRYKIGVSNNPEGRMAVLRAGLPLDLKLLHTITSDDAYALERHLHCRFADYRIEGEWFRLPAEEVEWICRRKRINRDPSWAQSTTAPEADPAIIAGVLTSLREQAGLTRYALAKLSGVSAQHLGRLEAGEQQPSLVVAWKICRAIGHSLSVFDELVGK